MPQVHDRGGGDAGPIDRSEHEYSMWEKNTHALMMVLVRHGHINLDEFRRAIEAIEPEQYEAIGYYGRWITSIEALLVEKGVLTPEQIDAAMKPDPQA